MSGEGYGEEFDEGAGPRAAASVEVTGLSLYTHHGVTDAEQEIGQRLVLDLRFDIADCDATVTDRVEDTIDYGAVCESVALAAQRRSCRTLEALCSDIADRMISEFGAAEVWVKASKPEPPIALPVESVSVELWRSAAETDD